MAFTYVIILDSTWKYHGFVGVYVDCTHDHCRHESHDRYQCKGLHLLTLTIWYWMLISKTRNVFFLCIDTSANLKLNRTVLKPFRIGQSDASETENSSD